MGKNKVTIEAEIDNAAFGLLNKALKSQSEIIEESIKLNLDFSIEKVLYKHGYRPVKIDVTEHLIRNIDTTRLTGDEPCWVYYENDEFCFKGKFFARFREISDPTGNIYECYLCNCHEYEIDSYIENCEFDCNINEVELCFLT